MLQVPVREHTNVASTKAIILVCTPESQSLDNGN